MSKQRLWPPCCLIVLLALLYGPTVLSGGLLATGDALGQYLPFRAIAAACYWNGEGAFWNPFNFSGLPMLAAFQGGVLYPGNLPFLFLPPQPAMNLTVLLAYFAAGAAVYLYARALELPRVAAFFAGSAFMLGGYMVAHFEHLTMLHAAALLPMLLWAVERHARTGRPGYAVALAPLLALQIFAGYPQTAIESLLTVGAYALWRHWRAPRRLVPVGVALALGLGLAAVQLLPSAAMLQVSQRGQMSYAELVETSLPPRQIASLLFPFLFGAEPSALFPTPYWGIGPWQNEITGYMGLLPLMLVVASLFGAAARPVTRFWAVAGALWLALATGGATPLYRIWAVLPVLRIVRVPGRHLLEVDLAIAILAACGLAWLLEAADAPRRKAARVALGLVAAGVLVGVAVIAAAGPSAARHWQSYMPAGVDLARVLTPVYPAVWVPVLVVLVGAMALGALARRPGPWQQAGLVVAMLLDLGLFNQCQGWRQLSPHPKFALARPMPPAGGRTLAVDETGYPFHDFARMRALDFPELSALWGVPSIAGYEPMLRERYGRLVGGMQLSGMIADFSLFAPTHHALDLLGCTRVTISPKLLEDPAWRARLAAPRWQAGPTAPLADVFTNPRALPLVWRAQATRALDAAAVDALVMRSPDFDPATTALLDDGPAPAAVTPGAATVASRGFAHLTLDTTGTGPGLVVVSEGYDAGWRASAADGRALPVRRVDGLVMGVEVPAGPQRVTLAYEPPGWRKGLIASGLAALLTLGWVLLAARRREGEA